MNKLKAYEISPYTGIDESSIKTQDRKAVLKKSYDLSSN